MNHHQHRRHARPCSLALQAHERELIESTSVAKAEPAADRFVIVLQAEPSSVPPAIRLRRLLKLAKRYLDLRCVDVSRADTGGCDHERGVKQGKASGDGE